MEIDEKVEIKMEIEEKIKVIVDALLEKERVGQLSPTTIQELKWIT